MSRIGLSRAIKVVAVSATALAAVSLAAPAANAAGQHWGTVYAKDSAGNNLASANGDFANNGGVYATVGANWSDLRSNGNSVYVQVDFYFYENGGPLGRLGWYKDKTVQSSRTSGSAHGPLSRALHSGAKQARAVIKVCEDINNHTDVCSSSVIKSFSY